MSTLEAARAAYRENLARAAAGDAEAQADRPRVFAELRAAEDAAREAEDFARAQEIAARLAEAASDHEALAAAIEAAREAAGRRVALAERAQALVGELRAIASEYDAATGVMEGAMLGGVARFPARGAADPLGRMLVDHFGEAIAPLNLAAAGSLMPLGWPQVAAFENAKAVTVLEAQVAEQVPT